MTKDELIKKWEKEKNKSGWAREFIQDLTSLQEPTEREYVKVPKDIYDKMVGECTLAAIRRGDFVEIPMSEKERQLKNGGVYIGD